MKHKKHLKELKAKTRSVPEEEPEFQIAPMIDILLVLLVFFMSISTTEILQTRDDVILPVAKEGKPVDPGAQREGELQVNIVWNDLSAQDPMTIYVNDQKLTTAQLQAKVSDRLQKQPSLRVVLRADRNAKYDFLKTVMKAVGQSGVSNIIFAVTDKEVVK